MNWTVGDDQPTTNQSTTVLALDDAETLNRAAALIRAALERQRSSEAVHDAAA